jgi:hypothetical protein
MSESEEKILQKVFATLKNTFNTNQIKMKILKIIFIGIVLIGCIS